MEKIVLCVMGSTASSKTQLAMQLHQTHQIDLISVDSAMIYRRMNIGTAKPTLEERTRAPHQLIDVCEPFDVYSAGQFKEDALRCIATSHHTHRTPLLVGGTMMYFKSLLHGIADLPKKNDEIRKKLLSEAMKLGWPTLHARLQQVDPESASLIHPNDSQRIQRALEVHLITGQSLHALHKNSVSPLHDHHVVLIALTPHTRARLHERIELRLTHMFQAGFLDEARSLYDDPQFDFALPAMKTVGYHQAFQYFQGNIPKEELFNRILFATRQLAKRQLTWLRSWPNLVWFDSDDPDLQHRVGELIDGAIS